jgi:hypothetical protein
MEPTDALVGGEYFEFQPDDKLVPTMVSIVIRNWTSREQGKADKQSHTIAVMVGGPGDGKSRTLKELSKILLQPIHFVGALHLRMQNALRFHITFENGTPGIRDISLFDNDEAGAARRIGLRMVHQLLPAVSFNDLIEDVKSGALSSGDLDPSRLLRGLANHQGCTVEDLTVIFCVDAVQSAGDADYGSQIEKKTSPMRLVVAALSSMVLESGNPAKPFCIVCVSATADEAFTKWPSSATKKAHLPLRRLDASKIFVGPAVNSDLRLRTVIDDMGGHPRALEKLFQVLVHFGADASGDTLRVVVDDLDKGWDPLRVMNGVGDELLQSYSRSFEWGKPLLECVFVGGTILTTDSIQIGTRSVNVQDIVGGGLVFYDALTNRLSAPFIFLFTVLRSDPKFQRYLQQLYVAVARANLEVLTGDDLADEFERQVALSWHVKTQFLSGRTMSWKELHRGARFNPAWDQHVTIVPAPLGVVKLKSKIETNKGITFTEGIAGKPNELVNTTTRGLTLKRRDLEKYVVVSANKASAADIYARVDTENKLFGISCKMTPNTKRTLDDFMRERAKAVNTNAAAGELFVELALADYTAFADNKLPQRCGLVTRAEFKDYFGPFASRLFLLSTLK